MVIINFSSQSPCLMWQGSFIFVSQQCLSLVYFRDNTWVVVKSQCLVIPLVYHQEYDWFQWQLLMIGESNLAFMLNIKCFDIEWKSGIRNQHCVHCCKKFWEKNFYGTKVQTLDDKWRDKLELELLIPVTICLDLLIVQLPHTSHCCRWSNARHKYFVFTHFLIW